MPGMGGRFSTIVKAKISKLLDRAEDPAETLDYSYTKQLELLQNVKKGIAEVVTAKKRLQMQQDKLKQSVVKLDTQARQALAANREDLARAALERKTLAQNEMQSLDGSGEPAVEGPALPDAPPEPQSPPKGGTGPRVEAKKLGEPRPKLLAWRGADGFPMIAPVTLGALRDAGLELTSNVELPPGGRRAGLLSHDYRAQLIGLRARQCTGWLELGESGRAVYAPHTANGFAAPANKTILLLANGFMAKRGLRKARKEAAAKR